VGHTAVSLKLNSKNLDYENPNERKFLLLIVATETETAEKLSSTATVTVDVTGKCNITRFWICLKTKHVYKVDGGFP